MAIDVIVGTPRLVRFCENPDEDSLFFRVRGLMDSNTRVTLRMQQADTGADIDAFIGPLDGAGRVAALCECSSTLPGGDGCSTNIASGTQLFVELENRGPDFAAEELVLSVIAF